MELGYLNLILLLISVYCLNYSWSENSQQQGASALTVVEQTEENIGKRKDEATVEDDLDPEDVEVFYPTNKWQVVKPGQAIPAGLHVRLNLETGKNEAKIPDDANGKNGLKYWKQGSRHGMVNTDSKSFTAEELKKALKLMKQEGTTDIEGHEEKVQKTFRPIKELMEDFEAMNIVMETDMEIINKLVSKFNSTSATLENKVAALSDLEYYVHQVDNAQHLMTIGGMQLITNALNATEPCIRENAAFVLGSALSGNPKVQIEVIEAGALQKLLILLATDQPLAIKKKALFAFSSMLRHFPFAQQQFLKLGGLQVLGQLFQAKGMESLRIRIMTLLYDMVMEKKLIQEVQDGSAQHQEKFHQYEKVNLLPPMLEQDWCILVPKLLTSTDHDTREKVLRTMNLMVSSCKNEYQAMQGLSSLLNMLQSEYEEMAVEEQREGEQDGYFLGLLNCVNDIIKKLG